MNVMAYWMLQFDFSFNSLLRSVMTKSCMFRITGPLLSEAIGDRQIPLTKDQ